MEGSERRDLPRVVLGASVLVFGASRPEWGRAMLGELAQVSGTRPRWAFALGCIRSVAFGMPAPGAQRAVLVGAWAGATASVAVVVTALVRYPGIVTGARTWLVIGVFLALLLAYLLTAAQLGARLVDYQLLVTAAIAGAAIAASWLAMGLIASLDAPPALSLALIGIGPLAAAAIGWIATRRSGSSRAGFTCVGLAALLAGFALFLLWAGETVVTAGRPYDAGLLRDFTTSGVSDLATYAVSDSLGTGMMLLVLVPLMSLSCGLIGAATALRSMRPKT
jgi:hypothetical protein